LIVFLQRKFVKNVGLRIKKICVCGAGTMGSGIAQVAAKNGFSVIQYDVDEQMLLKSKHIISEDLQKLVEKGKITAAEKEAALSQLVFSTNINDCIADVVIEAVVENKEVKQQVFNSLCTINSSDTILTTNTSSISISEICSGAAYEERFAGMHFFNPAPVMKLVEVVRGEKTAPAVIDALVELAKLLNKTPVVCNDSPGFIVNRVARHYYLEAMNMVEQGIANVETVDAIMEATGFKMGPFKLMDLIGLDVNYSVSNIVWEALGKPERLRPSTLQKNKVTMRELGRKTGKGFYDYETSNP